MRDEAEFGKVPRPMYLFNVGKKQRNRKRSARHKAKLKAKNRRRRASIKAGK